MIVQGIISEGPRLTISALSLKQSDYFGQGMENHIPDWQDISPVDINPY